MLVLFDLMLARSGSHDRASGDHHTRSTYLWIERIDWTPSETALAKSMTKCSTRPQPETGLFAIVEPPRRFYWLEASFFGQLLDSIPLRSIYFSES